MSKYKKVMMKTAYVWAEESYCRKRQVGAVIERDGHILDTGYNGTIAGADNICEDVLYECNYCKAREIFLEDLVDCMPNPDLKYPLGSVVTANCRKCHKGLVFFRGDFNFKLDREYAKNQFTKVLITNDFTVHAEQNILSNCVKEGISVKGATIYITTSPCKLCAKLIASSGIVKVIYSEKYKDLSGIDYLNKCNIKTEQYLLED